MRTTLAILGLLATASCARTVQKIVESSAAYPTAPAETPAPRRQDSFIQSYGAGIAAETTMLRAAGLGDAWQAIRPLVDAYFPPSNYTLQATGANAAVLRRLRVDSTTNFLVRIGYRPRHLAAPQQARSIVHAAEITAWDDADALVLVSPIVVVAALDRVERKTDGSEYLIYRVTERIKSGPTIGSEFRLLLHAPPPAGSATSGAPPPPPNPPMEELRGYKSAVFFLQPAETIVVPRDAARPGQPATIFGPMPISGGAVLSGYHSGTRPSTLAAMRTAAKTQQCSPGYVPVAGPAVKC